LMELDHPPKALDIFFKLKINLSFASVKKVAKKSLSSRVSLQKFLTKSLRNDYTFTENKLSLNSLNNLTFIPIQRSVHLPPGTVKIRVSGVFQFAPFDSSFPSRHKCTLWDHKFKKSRTAECRSREALLKGKAQYS
jgi:hypothetical protein